MAEKQNLQLSIIVPLYGVEKYIRPCIDSIFAKALTKNVTKSSLLTMVPKTVGWRSYKISLICLFHA